MHIVTSNDCMHAYKVSTRLFDQQLCGWSETTERLLPFVTSAQLCTILNKAIKTQQSQHEQPCYFWLVSMRQYGGAFTANLKMVRLVGIPSVMNLRLYSHRNQCICHLYPLLCLVLPRASTQKPHRTCVQCEWSDHLYSTVKTVKQQKNRLR